MEKLDVKEIISRAMAGEDLEKLIDLYEPTTNFGMPKDEAYRMVNTMITCANCGKRIINGKVYICEECAEKIKQEVKGTILGNILNNAKNGEFVASSIFTQVFSLPFGFGGKE